MTLKLLIVLTIEPGRYIAVTHEEALALISSPTPQEPANKPANEPANKPVQ